jgi:hypothetical protein
MPGNGRFVGKTNGRGFWIPIRFTEKDTAREARSVVHASEVMYGKRGRFLRAIIRSFPWD